MTYPSLAIIGTAGRKEDKGFLTHRHYDRMLNTTAKFIQHVNIDHTQVKLYSGGAAWADHLVVSLALLWTVAYHKLTVFLPAQLGDQGYFGTDERSSKTASTANYYHKVFSQITGKDSIRDLLDVRERGAILIPGNGSFHARNSDVAKAVSPDGALLAYTFGNPESTQPEWTIRDQGHRTAVESELKDGGTADTWGKATCRKWHCRIGKEA